MTRSEAMALLELGRAARLDSGPDVDAWVERLAPKQQALAEAVTWLVAAGETDFARELAAGVWRLWIRKGDYEGGRRFLATALDAPGVRKPTLAFAMASYGDGVLAFRQGRQDESRARNEAALEAAESIGDPVAQALALVGLSRVAFRAGDHAEVCTLAKRARDLVAGSPEPARVMPLHLLAAGTRLLGDYERARELYLESLELNRRLGDRRMMELEHHNLGFVEIHRGDAAAAREQFSKCSELQRDTGNPVDAAMEHLRRGALAALEGETAESARRLAEAEGLLRDAGVVLDPDDQFEVDWLRSSLAPAS